MNKPVVLSDKAYVVAEKQARDYGCESVEEYLNKFLEQGDGEAMPEWMLAKLKEGLRSPSAGLLTDEKIDRLVAEGTARARRKA